MTDVVDPIGDKEDALHEYGVQLKEKPSLSLSHYDAVIIAVPHERFKTLINNFLQEQQKTKFPLVIIDVKAYLTSEQRKSFSDQISYWRL